MEKKKIELINQLIKKVEKKGGEVIFETPIISSIDYVTSITTSEIIGTSGCWDFNDFFDSDLQYFINIL